MTRPAKAPTQFAPSETTSTDASATSSPNSAFPCPQHHEIRPKAPPPNGSSQLPPILRQRPLLVDGTGGDNPLVAKGRDRGNVFEVTE